MRLTRLFEDLGDKDEFGSQCGYCLYHASEGVDLDRFHIKHEQAEIEAERATYEYGGFRSIDRNQKYHDIFNIRMWQFGYTRRDEKGPWFDRPLKEDLGDKDEFGEPCTFDSCNQRPDELEFHAAHIAARQAYNATINRIGKVGNMAQLSAKKAYFDKMTEFGYTQSYNRRDTGGRWWDKKPLKEALEDTDEFGRVNVVRKYRRTHENIEPPQLPKLDPDRIVLRSTPRIIDYIYEFEDGALLFYEKHIQYDEALSKSRVCFKSVSNEITDLPSTFQGLPTEYIDGIRNFRTETVIGPASWRQELDRTDFGPEQDRRWREVMG